MPLPPGTRIGPYEIVAPLGAGGMGEVYRAHDARLDRDVAIKILPEIFAADTERLQRFEREAKTLAALNHPNIASIYGIEQVPGATGDIHPRRISALVMELVDGEDLSGRIARGALPAAEALPIARQIADALEAAHERGIIHRDLKPANVKLRDDGTIKVLDFGLAKALDPAAGSRPDLMNSPTITSPATQVGMILGTAAYMAPEQAKGRPVDKRADIWAFGAVLYEMLSGRRAFDGDDVSTTLAAVLMRDPDWHVLPGDTPLALITLMRRCLERDPKLRLRDIGEARVLLDDPETGRIRAAAAPPRAASGSARMAWAVAAVALAAAAVAGWAWATGARGPGSAARIEAALAPPPGTDIGAGLALSPDGRRLVLVAINKETGVASLWIRELSSAAPTVLAQTTGGSQPFWSPDGAHIGFFADGKLKKTDLQGSPPQVICDAPSPRGGAWGPDGKIVFAGSFRTGLEIVDAAGGAPSPLTKLDETRHEKSHRWPAFLPGGDLLLFLAQTGEAGAKDDASTIEALSISTGKRTRLMSANSSPLYSPEGYLLFWREGALRGIQFDARALSVSGSVFPVASAVGLDSNELAYATVSADGTLVYLPGTIATRSTLAVVDQAGRRVGTIAESVLVEGGIALSHDGSRLAAGITADGARDTDIWIYDLVRGTSGPLTFEEGGDRYPVWSAGDTHVVYANDGKNDGILYRRSADGRGTLEQVASTASGLWSYGLSRDGTWVVAGGVTGPTSFDLLRYDIKSGKTTPLVQSQFDDGEGALSPDEKWLAYSSDHTGRREVYVRSLEGDTGRWQISTQGGGAPAWRADGRELYFATPQGGLMAVDVTAAGAFRHSPPRALFEAIFNSGSTANNARFYAPMPDGQRFVVDILKVRATALLTLVTNWTSGERK